MSEHRSYELEGRERYYDTPDGAREELVSFALNRIGKCANGEAPAFYRGILDEHDANKNKTLKACGKSSQLCAYLECRCRDRSEDRNA